MRESYHVREQFIISGLQDFGYTYELKKDFIILKRLDSKGGGHIVTPWPVDPWGKAQDAKPWQVAATAPSSASSVAKGLEPLEQI